VLFLLKDTLKVYSNPKILVMGLLGFSSGLPLLLTHSTLALWLAKLGLDYTTIGLLSLTGLPYNIKFLWAPLIDKIKIPYLTTLMGRRRSWLLLSQIILVACLLGIANINPLENLKFTCLLTIAVSFSSATQDIVMLAYQVERLGKSQYGAGEAFGVFGYRMGMLMAGAGALYLSTFISWNLVYAIMAACVVVGILTVIFIEEPESPDHQTVHQELSLKYNKLLPLVSKPLKDFLTSFHLAVISPFTDFMKQKTWVASLSIMIFYKLGDNLIGSFHNIFYADLGFTNIEIANASKIFGMWASIVGGFVGGVLITRLGIIKSLFYFALIHGLSMLMYIVLYYAGHDLSVFYLSVAIENVTGGMRMTALFAYQMSLCNRLHAATQLALLTSCVHSGRTIFSSLSGWIVDSFGWVNLFFLSTFSTLPVLALVIWLSVLEKSPVFEQKRYFSKTT
jgi:PAT family beta-lactamase induction signal transducer AmpG